MINSFGCLSRIPGQAIGSSAVDLTDSFISFTGLVLTSTIESLGAGGDPFDRFGLFGGRVGGSEVIAGSTSDPVSVSTPSPVLLVSLPLLSLLLRGRPDPAAQRGQPVA